MIYPFFRNNVSDNKFLSGFAFKGFGRFTRRQRASVIKKSLKKIAYSSFKVSLSYFIMTIITKYGTCSLRIWINYKKKYINKKYNKEIYYIRTI